MENSHQVVARISILCSKGQWGIVDTYVLRHPAAVLNPPQHMQPVCLGLTSGISRSLLEIAR